MPGFLASYRTTVLGGKVEKMSANPGIGGFNIGKVNNLSYQSEGFPLTGYFVPACVGRWAWPGQKNCRRVAVAVGVIFLSARFAKAKVAQNDVFVENPRSSTDLKKENSLIYIDFT